MDEPHDTMRQVPREVGPVVRRTIFAQPTRNVDARTTFFGQLDIGVRLVVAQQDVVARLPLFDEIVLERQRFFLVGDRDVVDVARLGDQCVRLRVGQLVFEKVAANAIPQTLRLTDIDDAAPAVFVEINAGRGGKSGGLFLQRIEMGKDAQTSRLDLPLILSIEPESPP